MAVDTGALVNLQEIPLPQPVPYVPQTMGWVVVGVILLVLLAYLLWRVIRHWRANAYRREALTALDAIESALHGAPSLPSRSTSLCGLSGRRIPAPSFAVPRASSPPVERGRGREHVNALRALPALVKRTAIAAASRSAVASLSGDSWLRFLDRSLGGEWFTRGVGRLLTRVAYADEALLAKIPADDLRQLLALVRRWIRHHDVVV